mmetsp:Transcript_107363/g.256472  ORF Transcript_107363/g.256472 Transcript_107363/m.256472 type:complete len:230 (-) Transcript_107363:566-1255(-)
MPSVTAMSFRNSVRLMAPVPPGSMNSAQNSWSGPRDLTSASSLNLTSASAVSGSRARSFTPPAAFISLNISVWSCGQPTARQPLPNSKRVKAPFPFTSIATRQARPAPPGPPKRVSRKLQKSLMVFFFGGLVTGNSTERSCCGGFCWTSSGNGFLSRLCAQWSRNLNSCKVTVPMPLRSKASKRHRSETANPRDLEMACSCIQCANSGKFMRVCQARGTSSHACRAPLL